MEVWAHRSNNILSWRRAYTMGANIEVDISLSPGGQIITYHPGTNLAYETLDDLLKFIYRSPGLICFLDIKQNSKRLVALAIQKISEYDLEERIYLTAFQIRLASPPFNMEVGGDSLIFAKKICPAIKTHVIAAFPFNLPRIVRKYNPDAISFGWLSDNQISQWFFKILVRPFFNFKRQVKKLKGANVLVLGGILNTAEEMLYFADMGVDGIMTDEPEILINLIRDQKIS